jgi:hypothetical protein
MEKLENDDFNFDFQQNNDFQHVSIQVMTNVAPTRKFFPPSTSASLKIHVRL